MLACIHKELLLRKNELEQEMIDTIYFGGGTPSICTPAEIDSILQTINDNYPVAGACEITLEANPDDLSEDKIFGLREAGINRLSLGIQSFYDEDLLWMNRAHNALQAKACLRMVKDAGFTNISADLIFSTPMLTQSKLEENLQILTGYEIPHLSCYNLTVEEKTKLHHEVKNKKISTVPDEAAIAQFYFIRSFLLGQGYEHYEISNYARDGKYSKHNTAYWQRKKYLGVGPAAHSFDGLVRKWNIKNNEEYIRNLVNDQLAYDSETLSPDNIFNEVLLTGLRTQWGVNLPALEKEFSPQFRLAGPILNKMLKEEKLVISQNQITVHPNYLVMADTIASDLFII